MIGQNWTRLLEAELAPLSRNELFSQPSSQASTFTAASRASAAPRHLKTDTLVRGEMRVLARVDRGKAPKHCGESKLKMAQMQPTAHITSWWSTTSARRPSRTTPRLAR